MSSQLLPAIKHVSSSLQQPPNDPNERQNRVPTQVEMATLRSLQSHKRQVAAILDSQLTIAHEEHGRIQSRYENLLLEIEGVKSELNASHNHILSLERQRETLQTEHDEISGLLHPIRRCPDDILRVVFEYTVEEEEETNGSGLMMANSIASVCRNWRRIALQTGELWRHITISGKTNHTHKTQLLELIHSRIRSAPAYIWINNISDMSEADFVSLLDKVALVRFKSIERLQLDFEGSDHVHRLLSSLTISLGNMRSLHIYSEKDLGANESLNLNGLLTRAPSLKAIVLTLVGRVEFGGEGMLPFLRTLELHNTRIPSLPGQLYHLVGLETLSICDEPFDFDSSTIGINLPALKSLCIYDARRFPWGKLTAPKLRELRCEEDTVDLLEFIIRHGDSLRLLYAFELKLDEQQGKRLAAALVGIQQLKLYIPIKCLIQRVEEKLPFPNLIDLLLYIDKDSPITQDHFDSLTSLRCNPSQASVSREIKTLTKYCIRGPNEPIEALKWKNGPLALVYEHRLKPRDEGQAELCFTLYK